MAQLTDLLTYLQFRPDVLRPSHRALYVFFFIQTNNTVLSFFYLDLRDLTHGRPTILFPSRLDSHI